MIKDSRFKKFLPWALMLGVAVFFIVFAGYLLQPRSTDMLGKIHAGPDPKGILWSLAWGHHALLNDPAHLFRANIYYPHETAFAHSDTILTVAILTLPFRIFTQEPTVLFNIAYWMAFSMSGFFMFMLVRRLTGNAFISVLCGIFYAFSPYRLDNVTHLQYSQHQWLPLMLYFLIAFFEERRWWQAIGLGLATVALALSCGAYMIMSVFPIGLFTILLLVIRPLDAKGWLKIITAGLIVLILAGPVYYISYKSVEKNRVSLTDEDRMVFAPDMLDYFKQPKYMTPAQYNLLPEKIRTPYFSLFPGFLATGVIAVTYLALFGIGLRSEQAKSVNKTGLYRVQLYSTISFFTAMGIVLALAAGLSLSDYPKQREWITPLSLAVGLLLTVSLFDTLLAAFRARKGGINLRAVIFRSFIFLALLSSVLSFGPYLFVNNVISGVNIFQIFKVIIPGLELIRQVMHYNTFFMLFIVPASGLALARFSNKLGKRVNITAAVLLSAGVLLDYQTDLSKDYAEVPLEVPEAYEWLASQGSDNPYIGLPMYGYPHHQEADRMYWSMFHWNPMVNGLFSYFPPDYYQTIDKVADFPSRESIEYLQDQYSLRFIVVRLSGYPHEAQRQKMLDLFAQEWSHYSLVRETSYFWIFENRNWDESKFYNTPPPRLEPEYAGQD